MYKWIYLLGIVVLLAGCSERDGVTAATQSPESAPEYTAATPAATPVASAEVFNSIPETITPQATASIYGNHEAVSSPEPQYVDENLYEGDERGIVQTLNQYMEAVYEQDCPAFNAILTKEAERYNGSFSGYIISIEKLDFSVKPDPVPPSDIKPVVVNHTDKDFGSELIDQEKQLFTFRCEDGTWKFVAIADWW